MSNLNTEAIISLYDEWNYASWRLKLMDIKTAIKIDALGEIKVTPTQCDINLYGLRASGIDEYDAADNWFQLARNVVEADIMNEPFNSNICTCKSEDAPDGHVWHDPDCPVHNCA